MSSRPRYTLKVHHISISPFEIPLDVQSDLGEWFYDFQEKVQNLQRNLQRDCPQAFKVSAQDLEQLEHALNNLRLIYSKHIRYEVTKHFDKD